MHGWFPGVPHYERPCTKQINFSAEISPSAMRFVPNVPLTPYLQLEYVLYICNYMETIKFEHYLRLYKNLHFHRESLDPSYHLQEF